MSTPIPINEEATMDDVLRDLEPVKLLRTVQGLLLKYTSDQVRKRLRDQNVVLAVDAVLRTTEAESFTWQDLLESPFFVLKNIRTLPEVVSRQGGGRRLSGNTSKTARAVLRNFYGYDVAFDEWTGFDELMSGQDINPLEKPPAPYRNWGQMLHFFLARSEDSVLGAAGEVQELTAPAY